MTLARARIIKTATREMPDATAAARSPSPTGAHARARRVAGELVDARAEAAAIVAGAEAQAAAASARAAEAAGREAREAETARLAAGFLVLRDADSRRAERDKDRVIELATLLAERLLGEALRLEPARIAELAAVAIGEARGAERIAIDACPEDVAPLRETLGTLGLQVEVEVRPDGALERGSLVVHTNIGRLDARLAPQLARLAAALREALP